LRAVEFVWIFPTAAVGRRCPERGGGLAGAGGSMAESSRADVYHK